MPDGSYALAVQAQDGAGNTNGTPLTRSWTVTAPLGSYAQITVLPPTSQPASNNSLFGTVWTYYQCVLEATCRTICGLMPLAVAGRQCHLRPNQLCCICDHAWSDSASAAVPRAAGIGRHTSERGCHLQLYSLHQPPGRSHWRTSTCTMCSIVIAKHFEGPILQPDRAVVSES